jgi:hypothetical protein
MGKMTFEGYTGRLRSKITEEKKHVPFYEQQHDLSSSGSEAMETVYWHRHWIAVNFLMSLVHENIFVDNELLEEL